MKATVQKRKRGEPIMGYLTQREVDVLAWVACGHTTKMIAGRFLIAPKTVERHREALCRKLHAQSAVDLTRKAIELGLVTVDVQPMKRQVVNGFTRYLIP